MSAWAALLWGALASSSLFIGYALAGPLAGSSKAVALLMGFGAGTLVSAVGYQLVPEAGFKHGPGVGISFLLGALTYYAADLMVDRRGGEDRQRLDAQQDTGSPWAMFIGALLDGLPESFVLGITLALGGAVDAAFLAAVFVEHPAGRRRNCEPARSRRQERARSVGMSPPHRRLGRDGGRRLRARRQRRA
jgi:zinc transporter, ZIP family